MAVTGISANRLELLSIADAVAREKNIDKEIVIEAIESSSRRLAEIPVTAIRLCPWWGSGGFVRLRPPLQAGRRLRVRRAPPAGLRPA